MQSMWEDGTYVTNQSDDVDTSILAMVRDYLIRDDSHANNYKQRIKQWNTWFAERNILWF